MILRQERTNEVNRLLEYRKLEGLGEKIAEIDAEFYQMIQEYGPQCWADPDFMEDTLKKNPGMRLRVSRPVRVSMCAAGNRAGKPGSESQAGRSPGPLSRFGSGH